jgi:hypothetical protein
MGELARDRWGNRAHIDDGGAGSHPGEHAVRAQHHRPQGGVIRDRAEDHVRATAQVARRVDCLGTPLHKRLRFHLRSVVDSKRVAGLEDALGHGGAHAAQADESDSLFVGHPISSASLTSNFCLAQYPDYLPPRRGQPTVETCNEESTLPTAAALRGTRNRALDTGPAATRDPVPPRSATPAGAPGRGLHRSAGT